MQRLPQLSGQAFPRWAIVVMTAHMKLFAEVAVFSHLIFRCLAQPSGSIGRGSSSSRRTVEEIAQDIRELAKTFHPPKSRDKAMTDDCCEDMLGIPLRSEIAQLAFPNGVLWQSHVSIQHSLQWLQMSLRSGGVGQYVPIDFYCRFQEAPPIPVWTPTGVRANSINGPLLNKDFYATWRPYVLEMEKLYTVHCRLPALPYSRYAYRSIIKTRDLVQTCVDADKDPEGVAVNVPPLIEDFYSVPDPPAHDIFTALDVSTRTRMFEAARPPISSAMCMDQ